MRAVGPRLSQRCLGALADAGEIKKSKVASKTTLHAQKRYAAKKAVAKKTFAKANNGKKKFAKMQGGKKKLAKAVSPNEIKASPSKGMAKNRYAKQKFAKKYVVARS